MADVANAMGYLAAAGGVSFAVSFGLYAGWTAAVWAFGPVNIGVKVNEINLNTKHVHGPRFESES